MTQQNTIPAPDFLCSCASSTSSRTPPNCSPPPVSGVSVTSRLQNRAVIRSTLIHFTSTHLYCHLCSSIFSPCGNRPLGGRSGGVATAPRPAGGVSAFRRVFGLAALSDRLEQLRNVQMTGTSPNRSCRASGPTESVLTCFVDRRRRSRSNHSTTSLAKRGSCYVPQMNLRRRRNYLFFDTNEKKCNTGAANAAQSSTKPPEIRNS
jgi:hypothetical protein